MAEVAVPDTQLRVQGRAAADELVGYLDAGACD